MSDLIGAIESAKSSFATTLEALQKDHNSCVAIAENIGHKILKAAFPSKFYKLTLEKCDTLAVLFAKKLELDKVIFKAQECLLLKEEDRCLSQLNNFQKSADSCATLVEQLHNINQLFKTPAMIQESIDTLSGMELLCKVITPEEITPGIIKFCGENLVNSDLN